MLSTFAHRKHEIVLAIFVAIYVAWFSFFTLSRFNLLKSNYYDLGIMDQTVYNTSQGRILELTDPEGSATIKRMAIHNDILLAALAPLYWLYSGPETLLVTQTIVLALGAIFIYLIALELTQKKYIGLAYAFMYLMYPALQWSNTYDFHVVTFVTTLFLSLYYSLLKERYGYATISFFLILCAKEQTSLVMAFLGILLYFAGHYLFPKTRDVGTLKNLGVAFFLTSVIWFVVSIWVVIPYFRQSQHFALERYGEFGSSSGSVIAGMLAKPAQVLWVAFSTTSVDYYISLFGPLLFVSLVSPVILIALPELAINILSNNANMQSIIFHYTAVITPILFVSGIYGILYMHNKLKASYKSVIIVQLIITALFSYFSSPLPYSKEYDKRILSNVKPEVSLVNEWAKKLRNEDIIVSASLGVAPKFTNRRILIPFAARYYEAQYVVLLKSEVLNDWFDPAESKEMYETLVQDPRFVRVDQQGDFEVYQRLP